MKKGTLIEQILKETKQDGEKYFDYLEDKSSNYLNKLLKVVKKLNAI